jgi:hypothetical protein
VAGWGEAEYYFDYESIIARDITMIIGKRLGTKNDGRGRTPTCIQSRWELDVLDKELEKRGQ